MVWLHTGRWKQLVFPVTFWNRSRCQGTEGKKSPELHILIYQILRIICLRYPYEKLDWQKDVYIKSNFSIFILIFHKTRFFQLLFWTILDNYWKFWHHIWREKLLLRKYFTFLMEKRFCEIVFCWIRIHFCINLIQILNETEKITSTELLHSKNRWAPQKNSFFYCLLTFWFWLF